MTLAGAGVAAALLLTGGSGGRTEPAAALTQAQADDLAAALSDGQSEVVAGALAAGLRDDYSAAPGALLTGGGELTMDAGTFRPGAEGSAVVEATASGGSRYLVVLVQEGDAWRVLGTAAR